MSRTSTLAAALVASACTVHPSSPPPEPAAPPAPRRIYPTPDGVEIALQAGYEGLPAAAGYDALRRLVQGVSDPPVEVPPHALEGSLSDDGAAILVRVTGRPGTYVANGGSGALRS